MSEEITQRYFSLAQTAQYLGLSRKTLYCWAEAGDIPAHKLGRVWRFDREELDRFVHRETETAARNCYNSRQSESAVGFGRKGA